MDNLIFLGVHFVLSKRGYFTVHLFSVAENVFQNSVYANSLLAT